MKNKSSHLSRRSLLKLAALGTGVTLIYSYFRGIRFPVLSWEPTPTPTTTSLSNADIVFKDLINTANTNDASHFRAFAPEPEIQITIQDKTSLILQINNVAGDAVLDATTFRASNDSRGN